MGLPFICTDCGRASWNLEDLKHGWCSACQKGWFERGLEDVLRAAQCPGHRWVKDADDDWQCSECGIYKGN